MTDIHVQVLREVNELRKLGVKIPKRVDAYIDSHQTELDEYYENGMRISEIADLVRDLA